MKYIDFIINHVQYRSPLWVVMLPLALMGLDILTGLAYAWRDNCFDSTKMRSGLAKKIGEIAAIVFGILVTVSMGLPSPIMKCISVYTVFMEFMSIIENLDKLRVPIPAFLSKVVNNIDSQLKNDENLLEEKKKDE